MSVVAILGVVAAALVLLSLAGAKLLMRKFDRIYSGLEWSAGPKPAVNLSQGKAKFRRLPGLPKTFFCAIYWNGRALLDAAQGSAAAVSAMIELIAMAVGVVSALIFLTHVIDAYRA
jgi:hypothetical protein